MVTTTPQPKQKDYVYAVGRRKEAVARVRLYTAKGQSVVNGQPVDSYFPGQIAAIMLAAPFKVASISETTMFSAKVQGGGKQAQLGAVVLGIARALAKGDSTTIRPALKKHKLLTRDPRMRERRKVDTGGKARRQRKHPKR